MHISASIIAAAKRWGRKNLSSTASTTERLTQVDEVVELLAGGTSPGAQAGARFVLVRMGAGVWEVIRGAHRSSPDDPTLHVTVEVKGVRYHLRLDSKWHVFDITRRLKDGQTQRPSGHLPWVGPGA